MNIDKEKLAALAEAAQNQSGDYAALNDYGMAVPPAVTLALLAECKTIAAAYVRAGEREHTLRVELRNARQQLAERDALLREWRHGHHHTLKSCASILQRTDAALSASAEPKCSKCGDSGVIDDKEIDELPDGYFTERGLVACPDCEDLERKPVVIGFDPGHPDGSYTVGAEGASHE